MHNHKTHKITQKIDKHLSFKTFVQPVAWEGYFHPTIDLLFQISTTIHPRVGARNPQEKGASNSPLTAQNPQPTGILLQLS
jgi:hypothetical protein